MSLKFYEKEREIFKIAYNIKLSEREAVKIFKKLKRHYKLDVLLVIGNKARFKTKPIGIIYLPKKYLNLGLLLHEFGHALQYKKDPETKIWHKKKLLRIMKRLFNYCKSKNYWVKVKFPYWWFN